MFALVLLTLTSACEIDHGLGLIESEIRGRVIFTNPGAQPEKIDAARVVAVVNFPPQGLGDLVITNTSLNLSQETPGFRLPAPLARYQVIAAIYREKGKDWDYSNILGIYGLDEAHGWEIQSVVLDKAHPIAQDIEIFCTWPASHEGRSGHD